jgi:hypothetical protein
MKMKTICTAKPPPMPQGSSRLAATSTEKSTLAPLFSALELDEVERAGLVDAVGRVGVAAGSLVVAARVGELDGVR